MKTLLNFVLLLALFSGCASSRKSLDGTLTVGVGNGIVSHKPFERYAAGTISYGTEVWKGKINGGYWMALAEDERSSLFCSTQLELQVVGNSGITMFVAVGPGYIQNLDHKNSGHFQIHSTFGIGVLNLSGVRLGPVWDHKSDAGKTRPNDGRDIIGLQAVIPIKIFD